MGDNNTSTTHREHIERFMQITFPECHITGYYNQESEFWRFRLYFERPDHRYEINMPQAFQLRSIKSEGFRITFTVVVFVADFNEYHGKKSHT